MEGIHLSTAVEIRVAVSVVATGGVGGTVPCKAVAGCLSDGEVNGGVDGKVQGVYLRATVDISMAVGVVAAGGIGSAVTGSPSVAVAGDLGDSGMHRVVDGEV